MSLAYTPCHCTYTANAIRVTPGGCVVVLGPGRFQVMATGRFLAGNTYGISFWGFMCK